ncbi:MAG TPA: hypothetical protein VI456_13420, partial [Polyangia bacterium]
GNDVVGGLGHGITLGSVTWVAPDGTSRIEGPGRVQTTGAAGNRAVTGDFTLGFDDGTGRLFAAQVDSAIVDLVIADNRIARMGTNGISAITVLGMPNSQPFVEVQDAVISGNSVTGNLVQIVDGAVPVSTGIFPTTFSTDETRSTAPVIQFLPYAGITLATATLSLDLRGNSITDNGTSQVSPISGVFVLIGESLVISDNRITGNGGRVGPATPPAAGVRAGIAVVFADRPFAPTSGSTPTDSVENIGQLETLIHEDQPDLYQSGPALRVRGNSVQQPEGRALYVVATGPVSVTSNFFSSLGYHGNSNLPEVQLTGDVVYIENFARPWESFEFPPSPSILGRYGTVIGANTVPYLTNGGGSPYQFISFGGPILFQGNQVVYDWLVEIVPPAGSGIPLSWVPVALISTDHVTMTGNQVALRVRPDAGITLPEFGTVVTGPFGFSTPNPLLANIFTGGATNLTSDNRSSESPDAAALSAVTWGDLLNLTAFNQGTHVALAYSWDSMTAAPNPRPNIKVVGNQAVFFLTSPAVANVLTDVNAALAFRPLFKQPQN